MVSLTSTQNSSAYGKINSNIISMQKLENNFKFFNAKIRNISVDKCSLSSAFKVLDWIRTIGLKEDTRRTHHAI